MTQSFSQAIILTDFTSQFGKENGWQCYKHYLNIIGALAPSLTETLGLTPRGFVNYLYEMREKRGERLTNYEKGCIDGFLKSARGENKPLLEDKK